MNIVERMMDAKIVYNGFHASGMLNVLECVKLDTDEQRLDRCRLYLAWQKYFAEAKTYTNKTNAKKQARLNAIAGLPVPELPKFAELPQIGDEYEFDYVYNERGKTTERLIVVDVTDTHVMYKMPGVSVNKIFPMDYETWKANTDERRKVGVTDGGHSTMSKE